ncbi:MAG: HEAT repeat domain-containing protein, partial [Verrucomicrobiota bacterium]
SNPRYRARAIWLLAAIEGNTENALDLAGKDKDEEIRGMVLRIARRHQLPLIPVIKKMAGDASPAVRRECAIALRFEKSPKAAALWADLAVKHTAGDRWSLEALGIGSDLNAEACFAAWAEKAGDTWDTPAGRDIIWRARSKGAMDYLVKIITNEGNKDGQDPRYMRAFDFHDGAEKQAALQKIIGL